MFGLSVATELFQGSTERTWNCVLHLVHLIWTKLNHIRQTRMPRSRKRHHSRSRSRSRSHSHERSHERDEKHKKNDSRDKDREGKRRKIESYESPTHKRSVSSTPERQESEPSPSVSRNDSKETVTSELFVGKSEEICDKDDAQQVSKAAEISSNENDVKESPENQVESMHKDNVGSSVLDKEIISNETTAKENAENKQKTSIKIKNEDVGEADNENVCTEQEDTVEIEQGKEVEKMDVSKTDNKDNHPDSVINDSDDKMESSIEGSTVLKKSNLEITPKKVLSPKQLQKKLDSEKKRQQKQIEKEEKDKKKHEERERIKLEKLKKKEEKQREHEQKQKEKELKEEQKKKEREEKEEQKRKEREEKEQKRKEKEEKDEQKRKEREQEKLKRQQELEEKNKEKQKEEEIKQKTVAAFVNFFVPKKSDGLQEDKKAKVTLSSAFMDFEIKSDMKLPPARRKPLSESEKETLQNYLENQDEQMSYIKDLKYGQQIRSSFKTWPFEETDDDDDVTIVEDEGTLGETIYEDKSKLQKFRAKFLKFHENRRPAYFGTWRKKSSFVKPRKPFGTDKEVFNYEEDSDDDWEEEEQGESLNGSEDEADKENEDEKDDYEVDNEFFVPHGHLSDDEIDDEEKARLSPESLKQKLKLLKDEFDQDMQLKTHKLKPRSIGCIWYNKDGSNVEEAINRYLQPLAIISNGQIKINKRNLVILPSHSGKKNKPVKELNPEYIPSFLKVVHGNINRQNVLVEQFITYMANNGFTVDISKTSLIRNLKLLASWRRCSENGPLKNKFCWLVNEDVIKKYNVDLTLSE